MAAPSEQIGIASSSGRRVGACVLRRRPTRMRTSLLRGRGTYVDITGAVSRVSVDSLALAFAELWFSEGVVGY